jgi:hypothetical protein
MKALMPYPGEGYWPNNDKPVLCIRSEGRNVAIMLEFRAMESTLLNMPPAEAKTLANALKECADQILEEQS